MSVKRLVNSCVVNPIILRVGVNEDQGGLSKDITINTIIASQSNRFVISYSNTINFIGPFVRCFTIN